jgi:hypothetical protein
LHVAGSIGNAKATFLSHGHKGRIFTSSKILSEKMANFLACFGQNGKIIFVHLYFGASVANTYKHFGACDGLDEL